MKDQFGVSHRPSVKASRFRVGAFPGISNQDLKSNNRPLRWRIHSGGRGGGGGGGQGAKKLKKRGEEREKENGKGR